MKTLRVPLVVVGTTLICSGLIVAGYGWHLSPEKLLHFTDQKVRELISLSFTELIKNSILTAPFWIAISLTLLLQKLAPAQPDQKIFSSGLAQDVVWFFYETMLQMLVVVTYVDLLARIYAKYFSFLTITSLNRLPGWLRFAIAILIVDFLYWAQHYCNHKVRFLWKLHSLHHSQTELNFFTDFRYHVLEYLVRFTFLVVPFLILRIDPPVIASVAIFLRWYSRFYHGNIRTNLGFLRYLLVTPQSHRVHHSIHAAHADLNFGAIFSIWDFAFGTASTDHHSYPETGIADSNFPHGNTGGIKGLLLAPLRQMAYPFWRAQAPDVEQLHREDQQVVSALR
jgi:sterol desaturase/sphingolipid hydroxylase (fatty acid hydroxylase superfamily)